VCDVRQYAGEGKAACDYRPVGLHRVCACIDWRDATQNQRSESELCEVVEEASEFFSSHLVLFLTSVLTFCCSLQLLLIAFLLMPQI